MEFASLSNGVVQNVVNTTMVTTLRSLLNMVKTSGLRVVPIQRINLDAPQVPISMVIPSNTTANTTTTASPVTTTTGTVSSSTTGTTEVTQKFNCSCVAFRLDGIQVLFPSLSPFLHPLLGLLPCTHSTSHPRCLYHLQYLSHSGYCI